MIMRLYKTRLIFIFISDKSFVFIQTNLHSILMLKNISHTPIYMVGNSTLNELDDKVLHFKRQTKESNSQAEVDFDVVDIDEEAESDCQLKLLFDIANRKCFVGSSKQNTL